MRVLLAALAASAAYPGLWAVLAPQSFFDTFPGAGHHWDTVDAVAQTASLAAGCRPGRAPVGCVQLSTVYATNCTHPADDRTRRRPRLPTQPPVTSARVTRSRRAPAAS